MDSEDENCNEPCELSLSLFPELRLYSIEEYILGIGDIECVMQHLRTCGNIDGLVHRLQYVGKAVPYHFLRFCDTMKGFHMGSLDLSGRHRARYVSLRDRWEEFCAGVNELKTHSKLLDDTVGGDDNLGYDGLWLAFKSKWRLRTPDATVLWELVDNVAQCISDHPEPVLQKKCLLDLPPELLYNIMETTSYKSGAARHLGATCKVLRILSLPYIYNTWTLKMKWDRHVDQRYMDEHATGDEGRFMYRRARLARDAFMEHADYLMNHPDVARRIRTFRASSWERCMIRCALQSRRMNGPIGFQHALSRGLEMALFSMTNIESLYLDHIGITSAVARHLVSLPRLTTLSLRKCTVSSRFRRVKITSDSLRVFVLHLSHHTSQCSPWRLAQFFPHLTTIIAYGSALVLGDDPPFLLPYTDEWGGFNPFTLQDITHLHLHNLTMDQWDPFLSLLLRATSDQDQPIPLTHLVISAFHPFDRQFLLEMLTVLHPVPLEQLVIDGISYADPSLFEHIRAMQPTLASLTLKYRSGLARHLRIAPAPWPRASWEYAQEIARFPRLTHFSWNYQTEHLICTAALVSFEGDPWDPDAEGADFQDEMDLILPLFANVCPNLRMLANHDGANYFYRDGGTVRTTFNHSYCDRERTLHNPPSVEGKHPWIPKPDEGRIIV